MTVKRPGTGEPFLQHIRALGKGIKATEHADRESKVEICMYHARVPLCAARKYSGQSPRTNDVRCDRAERRGSRGEVRCVPAMIGKNRPD